MDTTVEQVEQVIAIAYGIVKESGIEEPELLLAAFEYALTHLGAPAALQVPAENYHQSADNNHEQGSDELHQKIAYRLGLPPTIIELLFDVQGNTLTLNLPPKLLPSSTSAAMREIAILLAIGRKHADISATTPFELIRAACDEMGRLDKKNFAAVMGGMKPHLTVTGKGTARELVPKRPADDLAKEIIERYAQGIR